MIIIDLLSVSQAHGPGSRGYFVKWSPKSLQYFAIYMSSPLHEHETKPGEAFQLMSTEMKFANRRDNFQVIRSLEGWICLNPLGKLHIPLAGHIINDEGFVYSSRIIRKCLTDGVVDVLLPELPHIITASSHISK